MFERLQDTWSVDEVDSLFFGIEADKVLSMEEWIQIWIAPPPILGKDNLNMADSLGGIVTVSV